MLAYEKTCELFVQKRKTSFALYVKFVNNNDNNNNNNNNNNNSRTYTGTFIYVNKVS